MTLAHVAGIPVEEWLTPLLAMGGGLVVALRAAIRRLRDPGEEWVAPAGTGTTHSSSHHGGAAGVSRISG